MKNLRYAVKPGQNPFADRDYHIINESGSVLWTDLTIDDLTATGWNIISEDEFSALWKIGEDEITGHWEEISYEKYNEMLDVLPPLKWHDRGFFLSEFYSCSITDFYQAIDGKYYHSMQNVHRPRTEILDELKSAIAAGNARLKGCVA